MEGKGKQPYLVYMSQKGGKKIEDMGKCTKSDYAEKGGWTGPRPLYMAGKNIAESLCPGHTWASKVILGFTVHKGILTFVLYDCT